MTDRLRDVRVVHRSRTWLALDKPSGVLSVPGKGPLANVSVVSWVRTSFPAAEGPITVHRLDMDTSGLLLVALTPGTQRELSRQFEVRHVQKRYVALVDGIPNPASGTFDAPMRLDLPNRPRQIIDRSQGKPAITAYRIVGAHLQGARLELIPHTGRTHQLRVHCASAGHPILGDILYGDHASSPRLMLHAAELVITDPDSGERVTVRSADPFSCS